MGLGEGEIFLAIMSLANVEKKREEAKRVMGFKRHGSKDIYIGGSKEYSYMFNMQSVPLGRIQCKMPPEKKS